VHGSPYFASTSGPLKPILLLQFGESGFDFWQTGGFAPNPVHLWYT